MTQTIALHRITLCSFFALTLSGCLIKAGDLEAGLDEDADTEGGNESEALECLMGTERDTIGVAQSLWQPECEVTCADGWGHDGAQLEVAFTLEHEPPVPDQPHQPRALGLLANEDAVVAIDIGGAIDLQFFDTAAKLGYGGYSVDNLGSIIYSVAMHSEVLYVTHGNDDGNIALRAVDVSSQQQLWEQSFAGFWATEVARDGGKLAFSLLTDSELSEYELVVLDLDGNAQWSQPTVENANVVAISPSGEFIAVSGERTRVYASEDGELVDEFVHGFGYQVWPQAATFVGDDRVVTVGAGIEYERFDGWLAGHSLVGGSSWEQAYNRATAWCPDPVEDDQWSAATTELLGDVTLLTDGTLIVVGTENYEGGGVFGSHPWVARISSEGEFLSRDRGLWDGYTIDSVAGADSVYVLIADGPATACEAPCDPATQGFALRKYVP